jgi:hypothetical protein
MVNPQLVPEKGLAIKVEQQPKQPVAEQARLPVGVEHNPERELEKYLSIEQGPVLFCSGHYAIVKTW